MNNIADIKNLSRLVRNLISTGVITETEFDTGRCCVQTGGMQTTWLTCRVGHSRAWWAPSVGEQVLILAIGGELGTAFVLPGIFSDDHPAQSA